MTLLSEAKGVTVPPIPEAEKPHNTSKYPQTQTLPTEVATTSNSVFLHLLLPITNKKRIYIWQPTNK
ncbi:hypothetical protein BRARA_G00385 [Brassica rapa]|uniref:Uncharacterized protein n=1 Tax=Brassica campestris TaxID=3711 RepID=A0A397YQ66_BRACM|nr:hypothetical protein BRARA_G00385 [Brassica rapa]